MRLNTQVIQKEVTQQPWKHLFYFLFITVSSHLAVFLFVGGQSKPGCDLWSADTHKLRSHFVMVTLPHIRIQGQRFYVTEEPNKVCLHDFAQK